MIRSFFLLLLLVVSLVAQSNQQLLKRADKFSHSSSKTDQFRAYNDYKNLYLRALLDEDETVRLKALKGIVKSGRKLHIDISKYATELEAYSRNKRVTRQQIKKSPKRVQKIERKVQKSTKKRKKLYVRTSNKLNAVQWKESRLILRFEKPLENKQVNYFKMYDAKKKRYKYVFDIHASLLKRSHTLRHKGIDRIRLAQFNQNTLRLVFENKKKLPVRFKIDDTELVIRTVKEQNKKWHSPKAKQRQITLNPPRLDHNKIIVIDPGHGGKDPGATGYKGVREKDVVLKIGRELRSILKARGYKVYMTRSSDKFIKLRNRTKYANRKKADLFISIHANAINKKSAASTQGIECYFLSKSRSSRAKKVAAIENSADLNDLNFYAKESFLNTLNYHNIIAANKLAIDLQRGMLAKLKKNYKNVCDAGVKEGPFWVLVGAQMPAVLVEVGFITHPVEGTRLRSRRYQKQIAQGLANGVERYFLNN
jgi:N-acetylmuramoyl-L-alanine amidase